MVKIGSLLAEIGAEAVRWNGGGGVEGPEYWNPHRFPTVWPQINPIKQKINVSTNILPELFSWHFITHDSVNEYESDWFNWKWSCATSHKNLRNKNACDWNVDISVSIVLLLCVICIIYTVYKYVGLLMRGKVGRPLLCWIFFMFYLRFWSSSPIGHPASFKLARSYKSIYEKAS